MADLTLPTNPRDQKLLALTVVFLAAAGAFWWFMYNPKQQELTVLQARVDTLKTRNDGWAAEIASGAATRAKEQVAALERQLDVMRRLVPTGTEVPALFESVSTAARRVGLDIVGSPAGIVRGDYFDTHRYAIRITGPYHLIAEFLANVGNLERIVVPMNLALSPSTQIRTERRPRADERYLEATLQLQTYVSRTVAQPAGAGRAGGGGS